MTTPVFRITISWDDENKVFIPNLEVNGIGEKFDRREKVEIIEQCTRVLTKAIKASPDNDWK